MVSDFLTDSGSTPTCQTMPLRDLSNTASHEAPGVALENKLRISSFDASNHDGERDSAPIGASATAAPSTINPPQPHTKAEAWMKLLSESEEALSSIDYLQVEATTNMRWTCRLCGCSVEFGSELTHCQGNQHVSAYSFLQVLHRQQESQDFVRSPTGDWSCTICGESNLETESFIAHVFSRSHKQATVQAQQERTLLERLREISNEGVLETLQGCGWVSDEDFVSHDAANGFWTCKLCSTGKIQSVSTLNDHLHGRRHVAAIESFENLLQADKVHQYCQAQGEEMKLSETGDAVSKIPESFDQKDETVSRDMETWTLVTSLPSELRGVADLDQGADGAGIVVTPTNESLAIGVDQVLEECQKLDVESFSSSFSSDTFEEFEELEDQGLGIQAWPGSKSAYERDGDTFEQGLYGGLGTFNPFASGGASTDGPSGVAMLQGGDVSDEETDSDGPSFCRPAHLSTIVEEGPSFVESEYELDGLAVYEQEQLAVYGEAECCGSTSLSFVLSEVDSHASLNGDVGGSETAEIWDETSRGQLNRSNDKPVVVAARVPTTLSENSNLGDAATLFVAPPINQDAKVTKPSLTTPRDANAGSKKQALDCIAALAFS